MARIPGDVDRIVEHRRFASMYLLTNVREIHSGTVEQACREPVEGTGTGTFDSQLL